MRIYGPVQLSNWQPNYISSIYLTKIDGKIEIHKVFASRYDVHPS